MMILAFFLLTFFSIISLVFLFNTTLSSRFKIFKEIEIQFLASFVTLAILGLLSIFLPSIISGTINVLILASVAIFGFYKSNWSIPAYLARILPRNLTGPFLAWILLGTLACGASNLSFSQPENLPDGPYVYKSWTKNVQVQWASADMPADNALPFFAGEFLVRGVDLEEIHPFAPGQEIVLRTFVVPFVYLTFRSFDLTASRDPTISYFDYVGTSWPNAMDFYSPKLYEIYTGVSIALQSFWVFALLLLAGRVRKLWKNGIPAAFVLSLFPFFLQQTYFTWTKSLCVAFALLSIKCLIDRKFLLSGLLIAFSYQIHPMALIFFGAIIVYVLIYERKGFFSFSFPFVSGYVTWQVWVQSTGLKSDLIQQNLFVDQTIMMHVFARATTLYNYVSPGFLNSYPPSTRGVLNSWLVSGFSIAMALLLSALLIAKLNYQQMGDEWPLIFIGCLSLIVSLIPLSKPSMVIFFGGQLLLSVVLIFAIRLAETWKIYIPWLMSLCLGPYLWLQVVTKVQ